MDGARLTFLGANRQVTGSRTLLEAGGLRILVDSGLFQEREHQARNWAPLPVDPASLDAVLLTHAHLDHVGTLPRLVLQGFSGPVWATAPTVELAGIVMEDSARIQEEDVEAKRRRHEREGRAAKHPYEPLTTVEDVRRTRGLLRGVRFGEEVPLGRGASARFLEAGHILGSASIEVTVDGLRIAFSGDVGQWDLAIVGDPTPVAGADVVVLESTYGDSEHDRHEAIEAQLVEVVADTVARGGNVVIPTFAVERAQSVLFHLANAIAERRIHGLPIFLDSPMAVDVTEVYTRYTEFMDDRTRAFFLDGHARDVRGWLRLVRSRDESKAINAHRGPAVIMAGSGMATGGRVKHHLVQNLGRPESTVLFAGYQARGTLGRQILDGSPSVRIFGAEHEVRARVAQLQGLSAHADRGDLLRWLRGLGRRPARLFLNHGEEEASLALAAAVREQLGFEAEIPAYGETAALRSAA